MYVSIREGMLRAMNMPDPFEALAALGLESVELTVREGVKVAFSVPEGQEPFDLASEDACRALKDRLAGKGVSACALLMANDFSSDDLEGETEALVTICRAAEAMGIRAVRIDLVCRSEGMAEEEFIGRCAGAIRRALGVTTGVLLGVENHGRTSNRPEFLDQVFGAVGDDRFGLTLDTGNFYWYGYPLDEVYAIMERYATRIHHTHIKNISYPPETRGVQREIGWEYREYVCPIYEGDIDHGRAVAILRAAGYDGPLTIEDESMGHYSREEKPAILKKDADYLRSLI